MITYEPFWETLKKKNETWYSLNKKHGVPNSILSRLKNNKSITMTTINDLCRILDCDVADIAHYVPSDDDIKMYK